MNPRLGALYGSLSVSEIQWAPVARLLASAWASKVLPVTRTPVTLQPCGVTVATVWIYDPVTTKNGSFNA